MLVAAGLAGLAAAFALSAQAANSTTYTDPQGDNQVAAADIVQIVVSNGDAGLVSVRVALDNRTALGPDDTLLVWLNTDGDTTTGCDFFALGIHSEYVLVAAGPDSGVLRCNNGQVDPSWSPGSFSASFDAAAKTMSFGISRADLGNADGFLLLAGALNQAAFDLAPDNGQGPFWALYEIVGAPPAPPPNPKTVTDPLGDAQAGAPDIGNVLVGNDAAGTITFQIAVPNRPSLDPGDGLVVFLNTDLDPTTGCGTDTGYGAEYELLAAGLPFPPDGFLAARCVGGTPNLAQALPSFSGSFHPPTRTITMRINRSDLGSIRRFLFRVSAISGSGTPNVVSDVAPNGGPTGYTLTLPDAPPKQQIVTQTTTAVTPVTVTTQTTTTAPLVALAPPDVVPPTVRAFDGKATRRSVAELRYTVFDASDVARVEIRLYRGARLLATKRLWFLPARAGQVHAAGYLVRRNAPGGRIRFCVRGIDGAGNRSPDDCAFLRIR